MAFHREAFERILSDYLLLHGLTPAGFAKKAGVSPGTLSDIRNVDPDTGRPRRQPSTQLIGKLASAMDCPIGALVTADPERVAS